MKMTRVYWLFMLLPLLAGLGACSSAKTFTSAARAGETVALAVGWKSVARKNLTVTITPATGSPVTYLPNDPKVRAVVNFYPDPSSGLVVGTATKQNFGNQDKMLGNNINMFVTGNNQEWWQSVILLDLPSPFPVGMATISMVDSAGAVINPVSVEVLPGTSTSNLFNSVYYPWGGDPYDFLAGKPNALKSLEQSARFTINLTTYQDSSGYDVMPHAVELQFTHTSGVGKPWVVNPRGDIKNVIWSDDGANLKVMVTPTSGVTLPQEAGSIAQFKFHIAGGITGLALQNLKAYDVNGNLMTGVTAAIQ